MSGGIIGAHHEGYRGTRPCGSGWRAGTNGIAQVAVGGQTRVASRGQPTPMIRSSLR